MYLVTGATGNVGKELVDQLIANGQRVRVFVRDPHKVAHWRDRVEVAQGSFEDAQSFGRAVAGTDGAFLMNGAAEVGNFPQLVEAAQKQKLPRIVFLSSLFASLPGVQIGKVHEEKENAIRRARIRGYFLRAGGFMSNTLQWVPSIKAQGVVFNPTGTGKIAPIAPEDIAAVAAKLLVSPNGAEESPEITGDKLLTVAEQVEILSKALGKPIRSMDVPAEAAVEGMKKNGLPPQLAAALGESIAVVRDGRAEQVTDSFERIIGRKPITFAQWAQKHAAQFA
jgi:(4-alkanoyl-5-oxo-2,5-dihydrofuran-3-yl)methyl phosphate reductase